MWSQHFGTDDLDLAKKCLANNLKRYVNTDPHSNPANFNLYKALGSLVNAVEDMNKKVDRLERGPRRRRAGD